MKWIIDNSKAIKYGLRPLSVYEGKTIDLLTLNQLLQIKFTNPDQILISIFGEEILAINAPEDTKKGFVAFGFLDRTNEVPNQDEGKCTAIIRFADDFGDNVATFHCGLPLGHEGLHEETGNLYETLPYILRWQGDMSMSEYPEDEEGDV